MKLFSKKSKETKEERTLRREKAKRVVEFSSRPFLNEIRPRERYVFHSDYFEIDDQFATIMSFFHKDGATDNFAVFWGINRIPGGLAEDITTITFEQIAKMTEGWIQDHQTKAEGVATINENEQNRAGSSTSKHAASRKSYDLCDCAGIAGWRCVFESAVSADGESTYVEETGCSGKQHCQNVCGPVWYIGDCGICGKSER